MLALQDLLKDFDVNKFRDFDIEEFAEFLLTGVSEDLEKHNAESSDVPTKGSSEAKQLPGRMVGSPSEWMESNSSEQFTKKSRTSNGSGNICITEKNINRKPRHKSLRKKHEIKTEKFIIKPDDSIDPKTMSEPDTLFGTYDEKTHSITICLPDSSAPIDEIMEEIGTEPEDEPLEIPTFNCTNEGSNNQSLMFSSSLSSSDEDFNYDPVKEFLTIPALNSNSDKSPFSVMSDHGYGSIGSPTLSTQEISKECSEGLQFDELWNDSFTELFPSLI